MKPSSSSLPVSRNPANSPSTNNLQNPVVHHIIRFEEPSLYRKNSCAPNTLIFKAVNDVENQFWNYPLVEREESILHLSLYYLQRLLRFY